MSQMLSFMCPKYLNCGTDDKLSNQPKLRERTTHKLASIT